VGPDARPLLHRHRDEFADRNLFFQLALGLVSSSHRLDALLARHGRGPGEAAKRDRVDEELIHFVLGLICFRDRVMSNLHRARREPPPEAPEAPRRDLHEVLR
jgi:hypothetical protein